METVLHGPLPDAAAVHGLLARLEEFGVEVVEMRRLHDRGADDGAEDGASPDG